MVLHTPLQISHAIPAFSTPYYDRIGCYLRRDTYLILGFQANDGA
jgi:hypothetical protein